MTAFTISPAAAPPRWSMATVLALALAAPGAAQAQNVPMLRNDYNLFALMPPAEAWLDSYVDCGDFRCDIAYRIITQPVDRYVEVVWKDAGGGTLVSGTNAYLSNFWNPVDMGGYIQAIEWRKGALGNVISKPTPSQATGTADFTGTSPGSDPCGVGYVCDDAEYYYWSNAGAATGPGPGATARAQADAPETVATISGSLSNVGVDLAVPDDFSGPRADFLSFTSSVELDNGLYQYTYTVSNFTDLSLPFEWSQAGLGGQLDPFAVAQRSFSSALAPQVVGSLTAWTLSTGGDYPLIVAFANDLDLLAPVPEPAAWALWATGLSWLAVASARRRRQAG